MYRWVCLSLAAIAVAYAGWLANDLRLELKETSATVNAHLPKILEQTQSSTETLAILSEDIRQLRDLAGASSVPRDRSLAVFADEVLDHIEKTDATVGVTKFLGSGLKDPVPAAEWAVGARKEALWLAFRARSKRELLEGLCRNVFGSDWHIQLANAEPRPLLEWLAESHSASGEALADDAASTSP